MLRSSWFFVAFSLSLHTRAIVASFKYKNKELAAGSQETKECWSNFNLNLIRGGLICGASSIEEGETPIIRRTRILRERYDRCVAHDTAYGLILFSL